MRLCEPKIATILEKAKVGFEPIDNYLNDMRRKQQDEINKSFSDILNKNPLCVKHNNVTPIGLANLLEELDTTGFIQLNKNDVNIAISNCSYEVEIFRAKYLDRTPEGKSTFLFKNKIINIYLNNYNLKPNTYYIIFGSKYYTVSGTANNYSYFSIDFIIEDNKIFDNVFNNDLSILDLDDILLCRPIDKTKIYSYNENYGRAIKCKEPRRKRIFEAIVSNNMKMLTSDDIKDLILTGEE